MRSLISCLCLAGFVLALAVPALAQEESVEKNETPRIFNTPQQQGDSGSAQKPVFVQPPSGGGAKPYMFRSPDIKVAPPPGTGRANETAGDVLARIKAERHAAAAASTQNHVRQIEAIMVYHYQKALADKEAREKNRVQVRKTGKKKAEKPAAPDDKKKYVYDKEKREKPKEPRLFNWR